ncbi:hypothetical protein A7D01_16190 [Xanthomonas arboricola]|nr:hypothetical protein A7D01_16190 [Xanthomonas arboricola]
MMQPLVDTLKFPYRTINLPSNDLTVSKPILNCSRYRKHSDQNTRKDFFLLDNVAGLKSRYASNDFQMVGKTEGPVRSCDCTERPVLLQYLRKRAHCRNGTLIKIHNGLGKRVVLLLGCRLQQQLGSVNCFGNSPPLNQLPVSAF